MNGCCGMSHCGSKSLEEYIKIQFGNPDLGMVVKFKKLRPEATIPSYAKPGDAGLDLVTIDSGNHITVGDYRVYKTGLAVEIPSGYVGLIFPRSSISKYDLVLANSVGVIDCGYRGEIEVRFKQTRQFDGFPVNYYQTGDRIAQLIIMPFPRVNVQEVSELSSTERGTGGFGSSGA